MAHTLELLADFESVLSDYRISEQSQKILNQTTLALMVGPSLSGRNTLIRELLKTGKYYYIVSDTTRPPRVNDGVPEQNGVEYWFRNEADMLDDLKAGKYLEAAIIHNQQVSGISIRELKKASQANKIAITDLEIVGTETILRAKSDTIAFFILPPSFEEWRRRLKQRGHMSQTEIRRRMESALLEYRHALDHAYYTFIVNDSIEHALEQICERAIGGHTDDRLQEQNRQLVHLLCKDTEAAL